METKNGLTKPGKVYRQVPNFNLVAARTARPTIPFKRFSLSMVIAVVILAEAIFISNLYRQRSGFQADIALAQRRLQQLDSRAAQLAAAQGKDAKTLEAALAALGQGVGGGGDDWKTLGIEQPDWAAVIAALYESKPEGIQLTSLSQSTGVIAATGKTSDYQVFLDYYTSLLASPAISQIRLMKSAGVSPSVSFSLEVVVRTAGG